MEFAMVDGTIVKVHRHGQGAKGGLSAPNRPHLPRAERRSNPGVKAPPDKLSRRFGRGLLRIISKGLTISGISPKPFPRKRRSIDVLQGFVCLAVAPVGRRGNKN